jgi:hypothetical protein
MPRIYKKSQELHIYKICKRRESVIVGDRFCRKFTKEGEGRNEKDSK